MRVIATDRSTTCVKCSQLVALTRARCARMRHPQALKNRYDELRLFKFPPKRWFSSFATATGAPRFAVGAVWASALRAAACYSRRLVQLTPLAVARCVASTATVPRNVTRRSVRLSACRTLPPTHPLPPQWSSGAAYLRCTCRSCCACSRGPRVRACVRACVRTCVAGTLGLRSHGG